MKQSKALRIANAASHPYNRAARTKAMDALAKFAAGIRHDLSLEPLYKGTGRALAPNSARYLSRVLENHSEGVSGAFRAYSSLVRDSQITLRCEVECKIICIATGEPLTYIENYFFDIPVN